MSTETDQPSWEALEQLAGTGDSETLEQFIDSLPSGEAVLALTRLSAEEQNRILLMLPEKRAAQLLEELPEVEAREMIEQLPPDEAAELLALMPSDEQADLITGLDADDAEAILHEMPPEEAAEARSLASYAADEAGGLMITEYLAYLETYTVSAVQDDLRQHAERYADYNVQYVYVVTLEGALTGVLRLRDLLLTGAGRLVSEIMIRNPQAVDVHATVNELDTVFHKSGFFGMPVTDATGRLMGVVRRSDVEQALSEQAETTYLKSLGIVGGEELRTMPTMVRSVRRLSWLSVNIALNVLAASVIAFYQSTLEQVIALAVFLPIISDMSGCAGNQAVAVSMRELALGMVRPYEVMRVWLKEVSVGMINGLVLGALISVVAVVWKGNVYLGAVVGTALMLNTILAVSIGGTIPLVLKLLKKDPALASGPILTTVTDMCGFFLVLFLATLTLPKLTT